MRVKDETLRQSAQIGDILAVIEESGKLQMIYRPDQPVERKEVRGDIGRADGAGIFVKPGRDFDAACIAPPVPQLEAAFDAGLGVFDGQAGEERNIGVVAVRFAAELAGLDHARLRAKARIFAEVRSAARREFAAAIATDCRPR